MDSPSTFPGHITPETGLVLASSSPSRQRMLTLAGVPFCVDTPRVDEAALKASLRAEDAAIEDAATALAEAKAAQVCRRHPGKLVIGADQMLDCHGLWIDKALTLDEARTTLLHLRGKTHHLVSSAVILRDGQRLWHAVTSAQVAVRLFSDDFLEHYIAQAGESLLTSVGCYHVEGLGAQLFSRLHGDVYTIQGLPLLPLLGFLRAHSLLVE